jgi:pimeloyl-ACP methyl ester carboxylesterase
MPIRSSLVLLLVVAASVSAAPPPGYHAKVSVTAPTRLDWTFALSNRSLATPPADWLGNYDSRKVLFELFVPNRPDPKAPLPLVLFISPGDQPAGWKSFETPCKQLGMLFVSPYGAGNSVSPKKRVRMVLDVLDEVRRLYPTDPDRTYLAGFSGGGRIAWAIASALPEHFGGVIPVCAAGDLREETWLQQRVTDRLSVVLLTGQTDFNRGEVERFRGPILQEVGVRTKVWVQPGLGHGIPNDKTVLEALRWLDEGAAKRAELARKYPATRVSGDAAPSREERAQTLLAEGRERLKTPQTLYSGLMLIQGVMARWPDLKPGEDAKRLLTEYEGKAEKPWEAEDIALQRKNLIARAHGLTAYATGALPAQYVKQRPDMAKAALELWKAILADGPDTPAGVEAKKRIPELEKLLKSEK